MKSVGSLLKPDQVQVATEQSNNNGLVYERYLRVISVSRYL